MKILKYFTAIILLGACNTPQSLDTPGVSGESSRAIIRRDTVYLSRNVSITSANAYSDLFTDSISVEQFIQAGKLSAEDEKSFRSFYNYRNGQFAWFSTMGFTEQAKGFWNLQDKLEYKADKALRSKMDTLLNMDTLAISRFDTGIIKTELALTNAFLQFYKTNRDKTQFADISPEKMIPVKKENALEIADTILSRLSDTTVLKTNAPWVLLKQKLQLYASLARDTGWASIVFVKQMKKPASAPSIALIKKRLQKLGEMTEADSSTNFNDALVMAVTNYQQHNGMKPTGIITDTFIRSINMPAEKRLQQIIINLNRMQWMPAMQDADYIAVNIPDFYLTVFENNAKAFDIPVAVGKEGTNTTMFTGKMNQIVFSPYWNIPASIVKREILPKMKADPNYLKKRHMEVVGKNDSLPVIRQLPGKDNALGKVKFLFPNRYDIYFHDSYAKDIFSKDKRAVSHGCIRVADAEKLANYLLRSNNSWTTQKVHEAMNAGKEQYVKLSPAMPVVITYYTAWVDETGQLNFRDDIYSNDNRIAQMMFSNVLQILPAAAKDSLLKKQ